MTEEERIEFKKAASPLMAYLGKNYNLHVFAVVTQICAELLGGMLMVKEDEGK